MQYFSIPTNNRMAHRSEDEDKDLALELEELAQSLRPSTKSTRSIKHKTSEDALALRGSWSSAVAVSSLHKAYQRLKADNQQLRLNLKSAEKRLMALLSEEKPQGPTHQALYEEKENRCSNLEEENKCLQNELLVKEVKLENAMHDVDKLRSKATKLQGDLDIALKTSADDSALSMMEESVNLLQASLDKTNAEKLAMIRDFESLKLSSTELKRKFKRIKAISKAQQNCSKSTSVGMLVRAISRMQQRAISNKFLRFKAFALFQIQREERLKVAITFGTRVAVGRTFRRWHGAIRVLSAKQEAIRMVVVRLNQRQRRAAFDAIKSHTRVQEARVKTLLRLYLKNRRERMVQAFYKLSFHSQRDMLHLEKKRVTELETKRERDKKSMHNLQLAMEKQAAKTFVKLLRHSLVGCFNGWKVYCAHRKREKLSCLRVLQRLAHKKLAYALDTWKNTWQAAKVHDRVLAKALALMRNRTKASVLRTWQCFVSQQKARKVALGSVFELATKCHLQQSFDVWKFCQKHAAEREAHARRMFLALQNDDLRLRFAAWKTFTKNAREHRADNLAVRRAVQRLMKRKVLVLFTQWRCHVEYIIESRKTVTRVLQRLRYKKMVLAFKQWQSSVAYETKRRYALSKICIKFVKFQTSAAFDSFKRNKLDSLKKDHEDVMLRNKELERQLAETQQQLERMEAQFGGKLSNMVERENALRKKYATIVIARGEKQVLRTAFNQFRHNVIEARHQREVVRSCVTKLCNRRIMQMFNSWKSWCSERQEVRKVATRVLTLIRLRTLATAFRAWRHTAEWDQKMDDLAKSAWNRTQRRRQHRVFHAWRALTVQFKTQNSVAMEMFFRLQKDAKASFFMRWKMYAHHQTMKKQEKAERQRLVMKAIEHMQQQCLVRSFNAWANFTTTRRCAKEQVLQLLMKATTRQRRWALRKWYTLATRTGAQYEALERVAKCCYKHALRTALATWRSKVHSLITARLAELEKGLEVQSNKVTILEVERDRAKDARLRRIINSWKNRSLVSTFTRWKQNAVNQKQIRVRSCRVLQRILHAELSSAFEGWATFVSSRKDQRKRVNKVLCRLAYAKLTLAFEQWQYFVARGAKIDEFIQRRTGYLAAQCFDALHKNCNTRRESKREVIRQLLGASKERQMRGFNLWRVQTETSKVQDKYIRVLTVATSLRTERTLSLKTFYCWRMFTSKSKLRKVHLSHLFMCKGRNAKLASVRQWKEIRLRAHVLHRLLRGLHKDTLVQAWGVWRMWYTAESLQISHSEKLLSLKGKEGSKALSLLELQHNRHVLLVRFREWKLVGMFRTNRRSRLKHLVTAKWRGLLSLAWFRLVEHKNWDKLCAATMQGFAVKNQKLCLAQTLHIWQTFCAESRARRQGARLVYSILMHSLKRRALTAMSVWKEVSIVRVQLESEHQQLYRGLLESCLSGFGELASAEDMSSLVVLLEKHSVALVQTNHLRLFVLHPDGGFNLCAGDHFEPMDVSRGIAGRVASSGSSVVLMDALVDNRFDERVDGRKQLSSSRFDALAQTSRCWNKPAKECLGLVSVPIFGAISDGSNAQVVGVIQASKLTPSESSSMDFLERTSKVLSLASLFISLKLEQFNGDQQKQEHNQNLLKSIEFVEGENSKLRQQFVSELKCAKQKIASLERKCGRAERLETEIRSAEKALKRWDHLDRRRHLLLDVEQ